MWIQCWWSVASPSQHKIIEAKCAQCPFFSLAPLAKLEFPPRSVSAPACTGPSPEKSKSRLNMPPGKEVYLICLFHLVSILMHFMIMIVCMLMLTSLTAEPFWTPQLLASGLLCSDHVILAMSILM